VLKNNNRWLKAGLLWLFCSILAACSQSSSSPGQSAVNKHKAAAPVVSSGLEHSEDQYSFPGFALGTYYRVKTGPLPDYIKAEQINQTIVAILKTVDQQMSTYRQDSELSQFNKAPVNQWVSLSPAILQVIDMAQTISQQTKGAFDISLGALVNLWGFGPSQSTGVPDDEAIAKALANVGYQGLSVRLHPPALKKAKPVLLDLSGIAKGFAVDQVANYLASIGVRNYLVDIGGEMRAAGVNPAGQSWRIGIATPDAKAGHIQSVLSFAGFGLATSGDYQNYFKDKGKRYSHEIDPITGRPVDNGLASVTVIANNAALADAYATAFMVMGPKATYDFANRHHLAVLLIIRQGQQFITQLTPLMDKFVATAKE
jgi:thiamine biosynthesis lipoprotein